MSRKPWQIFIGFDRREAAAYAVARESIRRYHRVPPIEGLILSDLQESGLYYRETERRLGKLWDTISQSYCSTEFSISRFLVPEIVRRRMDPPYGWALFMDCDVMVRGSLYPMIDQLDDSKALYCVQHDYEPANEIKMDEQIQYSYPRKNWSSVMAFNIDHPANDALTLELANTAPGRDLHRFCWLKDEDIGALDPKWNYLVGETKTETEPIIVHFTNGIPTMPKCSNIPYAREWFEELQRWAA